MSDKILISKVGLSETIKCTICKNPNQTERGCDGACQYDKELHAKIVKAVIGIAEQRPHGKWIPCSERLPEKDGKYLVTRRSYISKKPEVTTAIFDSTTKEWYPNCNAWMPLPEPYKKEGEKNESDHL